MTTVIVIVVLQLVLKMALYNYIRCIYEVAIANEIIKKSNKTDFLRNGSFCKDKVSRFGILEVSA